MIVCLAWGSLVWDPKNLELESEWFLDGPGVPVEFARQSKDGRLTLVLSPEFQVFPSLWARMACRSIEDAIENLRARDETIREHIGVWETDTPGPEQIPELTGWAKEKRVKHVIWTALPPRFGGKNQRAPTLDEAVRHLSDLEPSQRANAKEYVQKTPKQVMTPYRIEIERRLAWQPVS